MKESISEMGEAFGFTEPPAVPAPAPMPDLTELAADEVACVCTQCGAVCVANLANVIALLATQGLRIVTEDEVACHRQHEQCMKLLERCFCYLPKGKLEELVIEMLSKGELPEGWDK